MKFTLLGSLSCKNFIVSCKLAASPRNGGGGGGSCAIPKPLDANASAVIQNPFIVSEPPLAVISAMAIEAGSSPGIESDLNLRLQEECTPQDVGLATRKRVRKNRAQIQPTNGPKWAFGSVLRECRQGKGMSQEQLAAAAELDRSFISMVERGIQGPNIVILLK